MSTKQAIEDRRLLRRLYVAFKAWTWDEEELPYRPMMDLEKRLKKMVKREFQKKLKELAGKK